MLNNLGQVVEVRAAGGGPQAGQSRSVYIACDPGLWPKPGEYLIATDLQAAETASATSLPTALFRGAAPHETKTPDPLGFWAAASVPANWMPGLKLHLRGPLGRGFRLPSDVRKLALVNAGGGAGCLLSLADLALENNCPVVFFGDTIDSPDLPSAVEAYPLESLLEFSEWADQMAVCIPIHRLPQLRDLLGLSTMSRPRVPVEVLVRSPMPCGGIGKCGVCAFQRDRKWLLACEGGPVFRYTP